MKTNFLKKVSKIFNLMYRYYISKSHGSSQKRLKYLRNLGIKIGENCHIDTVDFSTEPYLITIGNNTRIGNHTTFITHDAAIQCFKPNLSGGIFGKIIIGDNVFIGNYSIVLYNTTIGNNCIIGAGSVVRGKIPDNSVVYGNPAKVVTNVTAIKYFFKNSPGRIQTDGLTNKEKDKLVKQKMCYEDINKN